jgi:hypothetical protein
VFTIDARVQGSVGQKTELKNRNDGRKVDVRADGAATSQAYTRKPIASSVAFFTSELGSSPGY